MTFPVVLGVDGGGSKTAALAASLEDGRCLGCGLAGPSNAYSSGFAAACQALEQACGKALAQAGSGAHLHAVCLGLAGVGRPEEIERFTAWGRQAFPTARLKVVNDGEILLAAGSPAGPALALVCGTGSIAYGRTQTGVLLRAGGWGYLFGDEGSGYAIGAAALRVVSQSYDRRLAATRLSELVLARCGITSPAGLINCIYAAESPRITIAAMANLVEQAAAEGDLAACAILDSAAQELADTIQVVYQQVDCPAAPLALTGGVILHSPYLAAALQAACTQRRMTFSTVIQVKEPAEGAVRLALSLR